MKHRIRHPLSWFILILIFILVIILVIPLFKENKVEVPSGSECSVDDDCPVYRCPGVRSACIDGFCRPVNIKGEVTRCVDLQHTICGNGVCEGDERNGSCPVDCA
jgi:hypothetical protein